MGILFNNITSKLNLIFTQSNDRLTFLRGILRRAHFLKKRRIIGGALVALSLITTVNLCYHIRNYALMERTQQTHIQKTWRDQISQFEKYSVFMATGLSRENETNKIATLRALSIHVPHAVSFMESVVPTLSKNAPSTTHLRIEKRLQNKELSFVIDIPLDELSTALGVKSLLPNPQGQLKSPWGDYDYVPGYLPFWKAFYQNYTFRIFMEFILSIIFFIGFVFIYVHASFSQRHYKSDELRALKNALSEKVMFQETTKRELCVLKDKISLFQQKENAERDLSNYISISKKRQVDKILALAILVNQEDSANIFSEELIVSAKHLAAGDIEINAPKQINLLKLLQTTKEGLALDLLKAKVNLVLDPSIENIFLSTDEDAAHLFFFCYLKKIIMTCFEDASLFIQKRCEQSMSLIIQGKHIDSSLSLFNEDVQLGYLHLSQDCIESLQKKLSFSIEKKENEHLITFHNNLLCNNKEDLSYDNIIPLFA